jgi:hypothetical protein
MAGKPQLADQEHVKRDVEGGRHFVADGDSASRQRQHHHVVAAAIALQQAGKNPAGLSPIVKDAVRHASHMTIGTAQ